MCTLSVQGKLTLPCANNTVSAAEAITELKEQLAKAQKDRDDLSRELLSYKVECDQLQAEYKEAQSHKAELQHKHKRELEKLMFEHKEALDKLAHDKKMEREAEMSSEVWQIFHCLCNGIAYGFTNDT